ncbi:Long chain acyl-CoA synthetase 1 [Capsicum annuum]|nr:Long chain acyl-CoA synthetase 1 [Capsicum annuum]
MSMTMFGVKVEEGKEGKNGQPSIGPVYRNPISKNGFPSADPDLSTAWQLFRSAVDKYPGNRMLGWRDFKDGKWGPYNWKTYKEAYEEILQTGSALRAHGIEPGARIGIYGANCPQWIVAMELLNSECTHAKRLKLIVSFTSLQQEEKDKAVSMNIKPYSWNEFLNMGKENPSEPSPPQPLDICTIMYTSGTSGEPKGVILTHENMTASITGVDHFMEEFEDKMTVDDVYISFLPLAHILDRMIEEFFFHRGASVGYFHGNINEIQEDMMALKPTFLAGVPRVYERVHEGMSVLKALDELNPFRRRMFHLLYNLTVIGIKSQFLERYEKTPKNNPVIFTRVMASETAKEAWDKLKEEFHGSDKIRQIKVINLRREFEILRMKDLKTIKEFSNKLMKVVNQIRLMGEELTDSRVVEKVLMSLLERFEAKISSLEDSKDLTKLSPSELVHALQAQEQRRFLRLEKAIETALQAKFKGKMQMQEEGKIPETSTNSSRNNQGDSRNGVKKRENFLPCKYCRKTNHKEDDCWFKGKKPPLQYRYCNKLGHIERFCRVKKKNNQQTQKANVLKVEEHEEFVFTMMAATRLNDENT